MELDKEHVSELLTYIDTIKSYDHKQFLHVASISELIWMVLMTYAGIVDYFTATSGNDTLNIISWLFASFAGVLLSIFLFSTQFETTQAQSGIKSMSLIMKILFVFLIIFWLILFVLSLFGYNVVYLSIVALTVGLFHYLSRRSGGAALPPGLARFAYLNAHWVFLSVSAGFMLVLNSFVGSWTSRYFGLMFALAYSIASAMNIYYNQNPPEWRKLY